MLAKSWKSQALVTLLAAGGLNGVSDILVAQHVPAGQMQNQAMNGLPNGIDGGMAAGNMAQGGIAAQQMTGLESGYRFGYHPNWGVRPIEWFVYQGIPYYLYNPYAAGRMSWGGSGWPTGPSFGGSAFPSGPSYGGGSFPRNPSYGGGAFPPGPSYGGGGAGFGGSRRTGSKPSGMKSSAKR